MVLYDLISDIRIPEHIVQDIFNRTFLYLDIHLVVYIDLVIIVKEFVIALILYCFKTSEIVPLVILSEIIWADVAATFSWKIIKHKPIIVNFFKVLNWVLPELPA